MNYKDTIEDYKSTTLDMELHPYENVDGLHIRTELYEDYNKLSTGEKSLLILADLEVINQVEEVAKHISRVYDFKNSTKPTDQWWWHLDKVAKGKLLVHFDLRIRTENKDVAL